MPQHFLQQRSHFSSRVGAPNLTALLRARWIPGATPAWSTDVKITQRPLQRSHGLSQMGWLTRVICAAKTECLLRRQNVLRLKSSVRSKLQARESYRIGPSLNKQKTKQTKTREKESWSLESNPSSVIYQLHDSHYTYLDLSFPRCEMVATRPGIGSYVESICWVNFSVHRREHSSSHTL